MRYVLFDILFLETFTAVTDMSDFRYFAFHCQYGYLNNTLRDYLSSLEVPCPKFLMTTFEVLPPWKDSQISFASIIVAFLADAESRGRCIPKFSFLSHCIVKDFDSTGGFMNSIRESGLLIFVQLFKYQ